MSVKSGRCFVVEALNRGLVERTIYAFHLPVGPGVSRLGKALLNPLFVAELPYRMPTCVKVMGQISELTPIVCQ